MLTPASRAVRGKVAMAMRVAPWRAAPEQEQNHEQNYVQVEIEYRVTDEAESKGIMNKLREAGFDQCSVSISLPAAVFKGKVYGNFDDFVARCRQIDDSCLIRRI